MLRGRWIVAALIVPVTMILMSAGGQDSAVRAQAGKKVVRMASARGVIFYPLWGIEPFAEKYGIRTEMIPIMTNAEQQRALQTGGADVATQGYVNPAHHGGAERHQRENHFRALSLRPEFDYAQR